MASNTNQNLKKHLVVIEYTVDEGIDPKLLPWHDLLTDAAKVTNWRDITPELIKQYALGGAFDAFVSESDFESVEDAMESLQKAAEKNDSIPDEISAWEPFEDCNAKDLLDHIEDEYTNRMKGYSTFLQHEVSHA